MEKIAKKIKSIASPLLLIGAVRQESFDDLIEGYKKDHLVFDSVNAKVADTRELIRWLSLKPVFSEHKLLIILNADKLNIESSNTLLKTLEEPPSYAKIILSTTEEQKMLPTIHSRCLKIKIPNKFEITEPVGYLSPEEISKKTIQERFKWVESVYEESEVDKILILWQEHFRQKLLKGEDVIEILRHISRGRDLLLTNISVKLLLENLTLIF